MFLKHARVRQECGVYKRKEKMPQFGTIFYYSWIETVFSAAAYYEVELLRDFGDFKTGTKFARVDMCVETGSIEFIDSNEMTLSKCSF